jgi:hypothetical protein
MTTKELDRLLDVLLANEFTATKGGLHASAPVNGCCRVVGVGSRVDRSTGVRYLEPTVHVRSIDIETIYVRLSKYIKPKPRLDQTSTLSIQLGYLEPKGTYHAWVVEQDVHAERVILEMKQAILSYGPTLWNRFNSNESIYNAIERGEYLWPGARPYKLPIVYGLTGRHKEAILFLSETAPKLGPLYKTFIRNWYEYFTPVSA